MITTLKILPAEPLRNYIDYYTLRIIDTQGETVFKPQWATEQLHWLFSLLKHPFKHVLPQGNTNDISVYKQYLIGLYTKYFGYHIFSGTYKLLSVEFNATGFYFLFGIPMPLLKNKILATDEVLSKNYNELEESLINAEAFHDMKRLLDSFFTTQLNESNYPGSQHNIVKAYRLIKKGINCTTQQLADIVFMGVRNFELQFEKQIGVTPAFLMRLTRFNKAVAMKKASNELSWTNIAYACDYFDQNHLIKDFKTFAGLTPNASFNLMPQPKENEVFIG